MATVLMFVLTYKKFQFSNTSYILMSLWIGMCTIGGHCTFERVPFDWFNNLFGFKRDMYDRIAHYIIGFYAYPLVEYLDRSNLANKSRIVYCFAVFAIFTLASVYEIIERGCATLYNGNEYKYPMIRNDKIKKLDCPYIEIEL